ncbi:probable thiopurine S-methyltransferase [Daphnia pulicaria]|uniref:probable thiopurine S-methyltransferase n=1 Tax=Daphnia pulicaria TaxID=35523 RepID=UPI001EEBD831|nr:probable thiopurine S-methyltransferase [Daphnia pulicaria]
MTHLGTNPKLMSSLSYFDQAFKIKEGKLRIFVPLCGKTQDLRWIYDQGHEVVGLDGVEKPIFEIFKEQGTQGTTLKGNEGGLPFYASDDGHLKIYHCDLFALDPEICGKFDGIWDCVSIIAILAVEREKYAKLIIKSLSNEPSGFLIDTIQYDQTFP